MSDAAALLLRGVGVLVALVALSGVVLVALRRRSVEAMLELSSRPGFLLAARSFPRAPRVERSAPPYATSLRCGRRVDEARWIVDVTGGGLHRAPPFFLSRPDLTADVLYRGKGPQVQTGDEVLDGTWRLKSLDPHRAARLFGGGAARDALSSLVREQPGFVRCGLDEPGRLRVVFKTAKPSIDDAEAAVDGALSLARALEPAG